MWENAIILTAIILTFNFFEYIKIDLFLSKRNISTF